MTMNEPKRSPETQDGSNQGDGMTPDQPVATEVLSDLEALRARAGELERERDQFLELLQRTRADFENYQKRIQRDLQQERRYSAGPLAQELLPALDNLERALAAAEQGGEKTSLVQGVKMVHGQLLDALKRHGITRMEALHKPFDPNQHQAVTQQHSADQPPNTVIQVLQPGYMIHDRVLRPASVVVAAPPQ
jgi:molecular chaperone GrpE